MSTLKTDKSIRPALINQHQVCDLTVFSGGKSDLPPREEVGGGPLLRDFFVVRYCIEGSGIMLVNDNEFSISKGDVYVLFAGDVVREINTSDVPLSLIYASLYGIKPPTYLKEMGISSDKPFVVCDDTQPILHVLEEIERVANDFHHSSEILRCRLAYKLFHTLEECIPRRSSEQSAECAQEKYVVDALHYMETNLQAPLTVSDVAAKIGINRCYLSSLFKQYTGRSPKEHLICMRIHKACELLAYPNSNVTNVANAVGMDETLFYRHFKRLCFFTPAEYKKRYYTHAPKKTPKSASL